VHTMSGSSISSWESHRRCDRWVTGAVVRMRWDRGRALVARRRESICVVSILSLMMETKIESYFQLIVFLPTDDCIWAANDDAWRHSSSLTNRERRDLNCSQPGDIRTRGDVPETQFSTLHPSDVFTATEGTRAVGQAKLSQWNGLNYSFHLVQQ